MSVHGDDDADWARLGDVDICFRLGGSGPPVLFVSGTGSDLRQRPGVFDGPLARHFSVLAYDHRGLGRSTSRDEPVTMADFADDAALLLSHVGWHRCAVVGVSFGGMVAQELALRHPDSVDRLVLCCTSPGGEGGASYPLHTLEGMEEEDRARIVIGLSDDRHGPQWQAANPERTATLVAAAAARAVGQDEPGRRTGARRQLEARAGHDTWDRLEGLRQPTLVCAGRYDGIAPLANSQALAQRIPEARLEVFEGGHLFLLQDERAWPTIIDFLGERA